MRHTPRGETDFGEMAALTVFLGVLALAAWGGFSLWQRNQAPDDHCYWLVNDVATLPSCLLDTPPPDDGCVKMDFVYRHQALCADAERLASFAQKAGRRICGQARQICTSVVQ